MRPTRLELEGFSSFRERCVVDFADADLLAIVGPTGAGKSSLLDAVIFALYGEVPRHGGGAVEPLVSLGRSEARVQLDFTVGPRRFRAARVVRRRTGGGATTKEARLELVDVEGETTETLAGKASEMKSAVESAVGLDVNQFCRSVVLPQGRFAELLHAEPKVRQEMLEQLLGLGAYERLASLSRQRAAAASAAAGAAGAEVEATHWATPGEIQRLAAEADRWRAIRASFVTRVGELDARERALVSRTEAVRAAADRADRLAAIEVPTEVGSLVEAAASTAAAVGALEARLAERRAEAASLNERRSADRAAQLIRWADARSAVVDLESRLEAGRVKIAASADALAAARERASQLADRVASATAALDEAQRLDLVAAVTEGLHPGDTCPVCQGTIDTLPRPASTDLRAAGERRDAALAGAADHDAEVRRLEAEVARLSAFAEELGRQRDGASEQLDGAPSGDELGTLLDEQRRMDDEASHVAEEVAAAERSATTARRAAEHARRILEQAEKTVAVAAERLAALLDDSDVLPSAAGDAAEQAASLLAARSAAVERARADLAAEQAAAHTEGDAMRRDREALGAELSVVGVEMPDGALSPVGEVLDGRLIDAETTVQAARAAEERHRAASERQVASQRAADIASRLATLLDAKHFRRWLLNEALSSLAAGASEVLAELSQQQYALQLGDDGATFEVVDHANADEVRAVKSLSGGETFLASLSLALALADRIAATGTTGASRLEALFIDEGFGSLDADALDVVASSLESLGESGRMVAVITHVRDLAERLPLRFEVAKTGTSRVERRAS